MEELKINVVGIINNHNFQKCKAIVLELERIHPHVESSVKGLMETEFDQFLEEEITEFKSKAFHHPLRQPFIFFNDSDYIGSTEDLIEYAAQIFNYEDLTTDEEYKLIAEKAFNDYMINSKHIFCYFDLLYDSQFQGRIVFELFHDICPKTSENFRCLCTGEKGEVNGIQLHYLNSSFHRIVAGGWVQGGDIECNSRGEGEGYSIYGKNFPDECLSVSHSRAGILSMANCGPHTNGSQFFITLKKITSFDHKKVAFGKVIQGMEVIYKMGKTETYYERPMKPWTIEKCGELS